MSLSQTLSPESEKPVVEPALDAGPPARKRAAARRWPLERVLFALAGTVTLTSAALAAAFSPWFLLLTAFVGLSQWSFAGVGGCPASVVLEKAFGVERQCAR